MAAELIVGFSMTRHSVLIKQLETLAENVRNVVAKDAIEASMKPVQIAMIANTPESDGSRSKQSASTQQKWSGSRKLKSTIRSVVRTRRRAGIAAGVLGLVGPSYSHGGGHGNLFSKDHKRKVLWGHDSGTIRTVNQFVKRTADQSKGQAEAAMITAATMGIIRAARATTNG